LIGASALYIPFALFYSQLRKQNSKLFWLILVLCVLTGFSLVWSLDSMNSIVTNRLATESGNFQRFFSDDKSGLESTSIGVRLISWSTVWPWIKESPLIGWGGEGRQLVMEDSGIPRDYGHLHSSYLDLLVSYGLSGGLLFFFLIWWLLKKSLQVWKGGGVPNDLLLFFWLFMIFWLIVNFFESYMFFSSGIYIFNIVCGAILTHIWQHDCHHNKVDFRFTK
jgi:O-antigen ligase